jgi:hypothetical protein
MTEGKKVNNMVNSMPHVSFHLLLRVKYTTLVRGITVIQQAYFLGVQSILMTTINITEGRTELSLMASKRSFGEFVMTLPVAIFQLDVSFRLQHTVSFEVFRSFS